MSSGPALDHHVIMRNTINVSLPQKTLIRDLGSPSANSIISSAIISLKEEWIPGTFGISSEVKLHN